MSTDEGNKPEGPISWVLTDEDVEFLIEDLLGCSEAIIDLETTGLDEHAVTGGEVNGGVAARISIASFTLPQRGKDDRWNGELPTTWLLPLSHPDSPFVSRWRAVLAHVLTAMVEAERPFSNANVKFDAKWIYAQTGVDLARLIVWDTQVSSHLLDENASTRLKERVPATFGIKRWDDHELDTPGASERVPLIELGEYAARDTWWTWRLMRNHRERMFLEGDHAESGPQDHEEAQEARLGKLSVWVAMPMVASLTLIEQRGIRLDVPWVREQLELEETTVRVMLDAMSERYGMERSTASTAPTSHWFQEFTRLAVEDEDLRVAGMTGGGSPQWTKGILIRQARHGSLVAQMILDQRRATKRAEYLRSWLRHVTRDGFIHTTYWPGRVVTGRLSSERPNMQQVTKDLRQAFIASDGHFIADFDYSQIELRVAAFVSRSAPMLQAFEDGKDLHRMLAARLAKKLEEDVLPPERQGAKAGNFGLLFGMGPEGFQAYAEDKYDVVLTMAEAVEMHTAFFDLWTGLREWHLKVIRDVNRQGFVISPIGRVRRLPDIWDGNFKRAAFAERQAINAPVQSFASDLMQMAAASMQGVLPGSTAVVGARPVATVHDSIVNEIPMRGWQPIVEECQQRMVELTTTLRRMGVNFDVPLVAEATVGTRWGLDDVSRVSVS